MDPYLKYSKTNKQKTLTKLRKQQHESIPNTFRLFEKYTGRYLNDIGDRGEFHKADNTEQKDGDAKPQFIRRYHKDKKQTTTGG